MKNFPGPVNKNADSPLGAAHSSATVFYPESLSGPDRAAYEKGSRP